METLRRLSQRNQSRRARQLVVFFIATIGNYDYADQLDLPSGRRARGGRGADGHHAAEGRQGNYAAGHGLVHPSGHLVATNVAAPHHQHFFNFRLDLDVDGQNNSVREMNTRARAAGPNNPSLNQ